MADALSRIAETGREVLALAGGGSVALHDILLRAR
jgi:hypothetical protein